MFQVGWADAMCFGAPQLTTPDARRNSGGSTKEARKVSLVSESTGQRNLPQGFVRPAQHQLSVRHPAPDDVGVRGRPEAALERPKEVARAEAGERCQIIQEASLAAFADLTGPSLKDGRDLLGWYDDFTEFLLEIAGKIGIKPALGKDRSTRDRNGWLFDAACALERFFPSCMRSQSPEARGKRLERSRKRLLNAYRQNQAAG
jgi:hypothetical protein